MLLQSLHQVALDGGDWGSAALMLPTPDPLARQVFGGDEMMLSEIYSYKKAVRELQTRQGGRAEAHEDEETPMRAAAAKAKAKSKGKKGGDKDV